MRWLSRSQKYRRLSGPITRPYGLLTCASEYPGEPVPSRVETVRPRCAVRVTDVAHTPPPITHRAPRNSRRLMLLIRSEHIRSGPPTTMDYGLSTMLLTATV